MLESALPQAAWLGYSLDSGCSQYLASGRSLPRDGLWLQRQALPWAAPPEALLVHGPKRAQARKTPIFMLKEYAAAAP